MFMSFLWRLKLPILLEELGDEMSSREIEAQIMLSMGEDRVSEE